MKKALIHNTRICQIEDTEFPVHPSLIWADVADSTTTQDTYVDGEVVVYVKPLSEVIDEAINTVNRLTLVKKSMPISSEGFLVQTGESNIGAMATEMFARTKKGLEVDALTNASGTATLVFMKNHHFRDGETFTIDDADQAEYNITPDWTATDKKTVTFPIAGTPASPATGSITISEPTFRWIDQNNNEVFWTADQVSEIVQAVTEYSGECTAKGNELKEEIRAAADEAEISSILATRENGWPDTGV